MNDELQKRAVNLGKSIGHSIINYDKPKNEKEKRANVRQGRKYIIAINKARTLKQFLDELIRLQTKFVISISNDILSSINENNWEYIKRFALINALNGLNSKLRPQNKNNVKGVKNGK